jgi:hypothetical protein
MSSMLSIENKIYIVPAFTLITWLAKTKKVKISAVNLQGRARRQRGAQPVRKLTESANGYRKQVRKYPNSQVTNN